MSIRLPATLLLCLLTLSIKAQLISLSPNFPAETDNLTITFDATKGNGGLENLATDLFVHTGVITDRSTGPQDWKYVKHPWGTTFQDINGTARGANLYGINIGTEYAYQYLVDETLRIADPYCEKILDPNNDQLINQSIAANYPALKAYPKAAPDGKHIEWFWRREFPAF